MHLVFVPCLCTNDAGVYRTWDLATQRNMLIIIAQQSFYMHAQLNVILLQRAVMSVAAIALLYEYVLICIS